MFHRDATWDEILASEQQDSPSESATTVMGFYGTCLAVAEMGAGTLLRALRIPLIGNLLALNQIFLISRALSFVRGRESRYLPIHISLIAALMKSVSPRGKRLSPLVSITVQGLLYNAGIFVFGNNLPGRLAGSFLSSLWSFVQPVLLYLLIFGRPLIEASVHVLEQSKVHPLFSEVVVTALIVIVSMKVILALLVTFFAPHLPQTVFEQYMRIMDARIDRQKVQQTFERRPSFKMRRMVFFSLRDLFKPAFLIGVAAISYFLHSVQHAPNWLSAGIGRPFAIGFFCFFIFRIVTLRRVRKWLERHATFSSTFSLILRKVLQNMKGSHT